MRMFIKSIVAFAAVVSLSACATGRECPPGMHAGYWGHCHPNG